VEACPGSVTGSPSVNLFIAPTGDVHVLVGQVNADRHELRLPRH
jgi:hypothetical protein